MTVRVLMVSSSRTWRGGERQVALLIDGLREQAHQVELAAPIQGELARRVAACGVSVHSLDCRGMRVAPGIWALRHLLRSGRIDVVHAHDSRAHSVCTGATVALHRPPWRVVTRRSIPRRRSPVGASFWKYRRGADAFIAISGAVRDGLVNSGARSGKISVIRSGIDLAACRAAAAARASGTLVKPLIGVVAALTPEKGLNTFVDAAALVARAVRDTRFVVYGEGPLRDRLARRADDLGLSESLRFAGFRTDIERAIAELSCLVVPSLSEGLGTSIMDAQAIGVPVVASRAGGTAELIDDGESGLLAPPNDAAALARRVERVLTRPEISQHIVTKALEISNGYDYRRTVYKTMEIYRSLEGGAGGNGVPS